jgi:hypothetical protein
MKKQSSSKRLTRSLLFLVIALPLAYLYIAGEFGMSLIALALLSFAFLALRPFSVSVRSAVALLVVYLAVSGLLNFGQPLIEDSWPLFMAIVLVSAAMQPVILILLLDAILGIFSKARRVYDMTAVVLLWVSTLAVTFGSTALLHTQNPEQIVAFLLFFKAWAINGAVFLMAALVLSLVLGKDKYAKKRL